jgi:hypothetical protein
MTASLSLKCCLLNAENLFLLSDHKLTEEHLNLSEAQWQSLSTSIFSNKPLFKLRALSQFFIETNPDIIMLCEVGGIESLENFNRLFLNSQYSVALIEGNSDRHIDVGFLVKSQGKFFFDLVTNKDRPIHFIYPHEVDEGRLPGTPTSQVKSHKFSRDVAELHLFIQDRNRPFLSLLLTHLKSRLDPDGIDPGGHGRRQAELLSLLEIYRELKTHRPQCPIVVAGDFNGNASAHATDLEFLPIYQTTGLKDVCEIGHLNPEERWTFAQISRQSRVETRQLDYAFACELAQKLVHPESVKVHRYASPRGIILSPPSSFEDKNLLPSDHYPLLFNLQEIPTGMTSN